jgi:hypothetical protein
MKPLIYAAADRPLSRAEAEAAFEDALRGRGDAQRRSAGF